MDLFDLLADLSRKDLLGLMQQMTRRISAYDDVDCFGVARSHVDTAVASLNENLADYPDVDPTPALQAVEYVNDILNNLDELRTFYAYGYDVVVTSEQNRSFAAFVGLTYGIGFKSDDVAEPDQFLLYRSALAVWEILDRAEALAVFGGCVSILVSAIDSDGIVTDYETAIRASEGLYHAFDEIEAPYPTFENRFGKKSGDIQLAVEALRHFLLTLSTGYGDDDHYPHPVGLKSSLGINDLSGERLYPRRWNWKFIAETVTYVAKLDNETPLRYAVDYVGQLTPGCPDDDPRLAALAESYLTSGLHTTMLDAVEEATEQLALMNDLTDMNRAGSTP